MYTCCCTSPGILVKHIETKYSGVLNRVCGHGLINLVLHEVYVHLSTATTLCWWKSTTCYKASLFSWSSSNQSLHRQRTKDTTGTIRSRVRRNRLHLALLASTLPLLPVPLSLLSSLSCWSISPYGCPLLFWPGEPSHCCRSWPDSSGWVAEEEEGGSS